jgi:hypothetical protein
MTAMSVLLPLISATQAVRADHGLSYATLR